MMNFRRLLPIAIGFSLVSIGPVALSAPISPIDQNPTNGKPPALSAPKATTSTTTTKKKAASKKKGKSNSQTSVTTSEETPGEGVPTALPPYKGPKRVKVNFDRGSVVETPSVVVRTDLPLKEAESDLAKAERAFNENTAKSTLKNSATVKSSAKPEVEASPQVSIDTKTAQAQTTKASSVENPQAQTTMAAVPVTPPAPTPEETPSPTPDLATTATDTPPPAPEASGSIATFAQIPTAPPQHSYRLILRTSYLDARYSRLEDGSSNLQNGASSMGLGVSRLTDRLEARLSLDIVHGLDQAITASNTRMLTLRVDALRLFHTQGILNPFVGIGAGMADYNVRSQRQQAGATITSSTISIKEHTKGTSLIISPSAGVRINLGQQLNLDLQLEYLGIVGGANASALGGLSAGTAFSIEF